jgi:hypothetical protein
MKKLYTELKRNNLIYVLKMLETIRDYTLQIEVLNENKKLHQFKAYETLNPGFIRGFLNTYLEEITVEKLLMSADKLKELLFEVIQKSGF